MNIGIHIEDKYDNFAGEDLNSDLRNINLCESNDAFSVEMDDANTWLVDYGTSILMTCNKNWYGNFKEIRKGRKIYLGDDHWYKIMGYGDIPMEILDAFIMLCMCLGSIQS